MPLQPTDEVGRQERVDRVFAGSATKWRNPGNVMQDGPPWSTTVVTPE